MISSTLNLEGLGYQYDSESKIWGRSLAQAFDYSDGDEAENRLHAAISSASDVSVASPELRAACVDWPSRYHLSSSRGNLLRPLSDRLRGNVLEIGAGCGAITRFLGENGGNIWAIEGSPRRARIAASRVRDLNNVCVVNDSFEDFRPDIKFDVITLIGVLEYAGVYGKGVDPVATMLTAAKALLAPSGILVIAIENQLGLKYFAGVPEDHLNMPMVGIQGLYQSRGVRTFGRVELESRLRDVGFNRIELALPFPDYKLPVSVILPEGTSDSSPFRAAALAAQTASRDAQVSSDHLTFSLECVWDVIGQNGLLRDLANSFLYVASPSTPTEPAQRIFSEGVLAYHYSMDRLPSYCKQVQFVAGERGQVEAIQSLIYPGGATQNSDTLFGHKLPDEPFYEGAVFGEFFVKELQTPGWTVKKLAQLLGRYMGIIGGLAGSSGETLTLDTLLPGSFLDAVPQNLILTGDGHELIDQEWSSVESLSFGYLLFRSLTTLIRMVSSFAVPEDVRWLNQGQLFQETFAHLGYDLTRLTFEKYAKKEADFMSFVTGVENSPMDYNDWAAHRLPCYLDRAQASTKPLLDHISQVQDLADTYIAQIKWLESENLLKQKRLSDLEQELSAVAETREQLFKLDVERQSLNATLSELAAQLQRQTAIEHELKTSVEKSNLDVNARILALQHRNDALSRELDSMKNSRTWKVSQFFSKVFH
jgi:2-polyprenyl-3-methyl-5-hydroxy-6-metoxy-1,4-benzoquinol methylase